jgi:hypothetical protein
MMHAYFIGIQVWLGENMVNFHTIGDTTAWAWLLKISQKQGTDAHGLFPKAK